MTLIQKERHEWPLFRNERHATRYLFFERLSLGSLAAMHIGDTVAISGPRKLRERHHCFWLDARISLFTEKDKVLNFVGGDPN